MGGLSAAALLSTYGLSTKVYEAHTEIGGCAHSFERQVKGIGTFTFDSGPSLFSGTRYVNGGNKHSRSRGKA